MRIISFTKHWDKLKNLTFSTYRYPYWQEGWDVQVFYKNRNPKERQKLGEAKIIKVETVELDPTYTYRLEKPVRFITKQEAIEDGFDSITDMLKWLRKLYGLDFISKMDKITLEWTAKYRRIEAEDITQMFANIPDEQRIEEMHGMQRLSPGCKVTWTIDPKKQKARIKVKNGNSVKV
jgi:hypothetical protein